MALKQAIRHLCIIGAFEVKNEGNSFIQRNSMEEQLSSQRDNFHLWTRDPTVINELGIVLSKIPVSPKYSKMLLASHKYPGLFPYAIMIVACMSVPEIYADQQHITTTLQNDNDDENSDKNEDRDLLTSIDLQR